MQPLRLFIQVNATPQWLLSLQETYIDTFSLLDEDRAILVTGVQGYVAVHHTFCITN